MKDQGDSHHQVRRVMLPSGKTIEVVYFEEHPDLSSAPVPIEGAHCEQADLHLCGTCNSGLVYPVEWEEAGSTHWQVSLRCPNCEWSGTGIFEQTAVERFDEELDRGTDALVSDLRRLVQANMEGEIERFVRALEVDAVLPEDFGTPHSPQL
jgi:hypothetical protein